MKAILVLPILVFASCVSRQTPEVTITPQPTPIIDQIDSVRLAETVRAYHIGRYADPNHAEVMHEEHPIYRIEAHGRWNLKPGRSSTRAVNVFGLPRDAAFSPAPTNDLLIAELNRQKDATERVMEEAARLGRSNDQLQKALTEMSSLVKSHLSITSRLSTTEQRIDLFEKELQRRAQPSVSATNEVLTSPATDAETPPE